MRSRLRHSLIRLLAAWPRLYQETKWIESYLRFRAGRLHDPEFGVLRHLAPPRLVIDAGGNYGQSLFSLRLLFPNARLLSFEPDPTSLRFLQRTSGRLAGTEVHATALGRQTGNATLRIPQHGGTEFSQAATIAAGAISAPNFERIFGNDLTIKAVTVDVMPLDKLRLRPDLIKIDVQGSELEVLEGAAETIATARPVLFVERGSTESQCRAFLERHGYRCQIIGQGPRSPTNFLAVPEENQELMRNLACEEIGFPQERALPHGPA